MLSDELRSKFLEALKNHDDWIDYIKVFEEIGAEPDVNLINKLHAEGKIELNESVGRIDVPPVNTTIKFSPGNFTAILIKKTKQN